jgi:hypothetical protein
MGSFGGFGDPYGANDVGGMYGQVTGRGMGSGTPFGNQVMNMRAGANSQNANMLFQLLTMLTGGKLAGMKAMSDAYPKGSFADQGFGQEQGFDSVSPHLFGQASAPSDPRGRYDYASADAFPRADESSARVQRAGQISPATSTVGQPNARSQWIQRLMEHLDDFDGGGSAPGRAPEPGGNSLAARGYPGGGEAPNANYLRFNKGPNPPFALGGANGMGPFPDWSSGMSTGSYS